MSEKKIFIASFVHLVIAVLVSILTIFLVTKQIKVGSYEMFAFSFSGFIVLLFLAFTKMEIILLVSVVNRLLIVLVLGYATVKLNTFKKQCLAYLGHIILSFVLSYSGLFLSVALKQ